eukprot:4662343-Pyramimonas_sp.AAC.3
MGVHMVWMLIGFYWGDLQQASKEQKEKLKAMLSQWKEAWRSTSLVIVAEASMNAEHEREKERYEVAALFTVW